MAALGRTMSFFVPDEQARQPPRDLLADLQQVQLPARADRTLDLRIVA
jgi:hypothetical protein